jgi:hypothetical protein
MGVYLFVWLLFLEAVSKSRLTPHGGVAVWLEMLTVSRICSAFSPARALPWGVIRIFETASKRVLTRVFFLNIVQINEQRSFVKKNVFSPTPKSERRGK